MTARGDLEALLELSETKFRQRQIAHSVIRKEIDLLLREIDDLETGLSTSLRSITAESPAVRAGVVPAWQKWTNRQLRLVHGKLAHAKAREADSRWRMEQEFRKFDAVSRLVDAKKADDQLAQRRRDDG